MTPCQAIQAYVLLACLRLEQAASFPLHSEFCEIYENTRFGGGYGVQLFPNSAENFDTSRTLMFPSPLKSRSLWWMRMASFASLGSEYCR